MLTRDRVRELLDYNPETGVFTWKVKRKSVNPGDEAGALKANGYRNITIDSRQYGAHRLAWLYSYGRFPREFIDHVNRDKLDNRLCNLREATAQQNTHNRRGDRDSKTGLKGVYPRRNGRCFEAAIMRDGKLNYLGQFPTREAASAAYTAAARRLHGDFSYQ
jgi:hypothetical protein